ncbi:hypothetical protein ACFFMN_40030 [Planobispora siamensis]|uniref:Uncharacterized protein n=1 Tax=Planobispora siamensis TaxID=936338 RepID=A0A8J3SU57_9ACTN|nr:hypothetical protein [Planobispora siamensis]GIH95668.1 hypothetical protein Psi01_62980 [Planobispora siamensis]
MLDEHEARAVTTLLETLADRLGDDPLGADARRMATALRRRLDGAAVIPGRTDHRAAQAGRERTDPGQTGRGRADRERTVVERGPTVVERGRQGPPWPDGEPARSESTRARRLLADLRDARGRTEDVIGRCEQARQNAMAAQRRAEQLTRRVLELQARRQGASDGGVQHM